jgi:hypothetical protein
MNEIPRPRGRDRNLPCACGSGTKTKKCLPLHPPTMDQLWAEALEEDYDRFKRSPAERARGRRALQTLVLATAVIGA